MIVETIYVGKDAFLYLESCIKKRSLQDAMRLWERAISALDLDSKHTEFVEIKVQKYFRTKGAMLAYLNSMGADYIPEMKSGNKIRIRNRNQNSKSDSKIRKTKTMPKFYEGSYKYDY